MTLFVGIPTARTEIRPGSALPLPWSYLVLCPFGQPHRVMSMAKYLGGAVLQYKCLDYQ